MDFENRPPTPPIPPNEPPNEPFDPFDDFPDDDEPSSQPTTPLPSAQPQPPPSEQPAPPAFKLATDAPPPPPSSDTDAEGRPKRGSARDRYERRKQQAAPTKAKSSSARRQIAVPQNINLPKIPGGTLTLIGAGAAIIFVVLIVYVLGRVRNSTLETQPNAVWLGTEWTYDTHTDDQIADLVKKMRDRHVGTIYAYVSYLQFNGTWRNEDKFDNIKTFVQQFKKAYPEAHLYGLVGVPTSDAVHPPRLMDVTLQQQVADLSKRLTTDFAFEGIFLDAEPVWDGDQDFLALLRAVRAAVGIKVPISAAIPPDWSPSNPTIPVPPLIQPNTEWKKEYKQSVALLVDQMAVMVFNSGLSSPADYSQWVAYQVSTFADAIGELKTNTELLIAIPTFDAELPGHDPAIENVDSAVAGVNAGLQQAGANATTVKGLAIYADWTTDDTEWADFQKVWVAK